MSERDREWAKALIEDGDEVAFRQLYRSHTPRLHQVVVRFLGSEDEAEDLVQETWVRAVRGLRRFRWQSAFSTWLTGIGLNLCREQLRRRRPAGPNGEDVAEELAIPTVPEGLRIDLERAIALLPDGCRLVLVLHDLEGWTHDEIGRHMGISAGTSKSQLWTARTRVRSWLRPAQGDDDA